MATHTLHIQNIHVIMLESLLSAPSWAKDAQLLYTGGVLLENLEEVRGDEMPEYTGKPDDKEAIAAHNEAMVTWNKIEQDVELTERQREVLKTCLSYGIGQGNIIPSPIHGSLLTQLGLVEGE